MSNKVSIEVPAYFIVLGIEVSYRFAWKVYTGVALFGLWEFFTPDEFSGNFSIEGIIAYVIISGGMAFHCWLKRNETVMQDIDLDRDL
jgi:hypothetical protein